MRSMSTLCLFDISAQVISCIYDKKTKSSLAHQLSNSTKPHQVQLIGKRGLFALSIAFISSIKSSLQKDTKRHVKTPKDTQVMSISVSTDSS